MRSSKQTQAGNRRRATTPSGLKKPSTSHTPLRSYGSSRQDAAFRAALARFLRSQLRFGMSLASMAARSAKSPDDRRHYAARAAAVQATVLRFLAKDLLLPDDDAEIRRAVNTLSLAIGSITR
jgi:hypothetical protein